MASVGACLIANEPEGLANKMLERRIAGVSWKEIADEFGLGSPSTARKQFTKLTGITDYKAKGDALKQIASKLNGLQEGQVKAASAAIKEVKVTPMTKELRKEITGEFASEANLAKLKDVEDAIDSMYGEGKAQKVSDFLKEKKGYQEIKSATGVDFKDIDALNWSELKIQYKTWDAYLQKPTSETGFNAVKEMILKSRANGLEVQELVQLTNVPETVVNAILKETWHAPSPGSVKPFIPEAPPGPPKSTGKIGPSGDFQYHPISRWNEWADQLGNDMSSSELAAVQSYTGSGYVNINSGLRSGQSPRNVARMDSAMRPTPFDARVTRQVSPNAFRSLGINSPKDLHDHVGKVFSDDGFMSTTIVEHGVWGGDIKMKIDMPQGTMGRWVGNGISHHNSEREFILARGTSMMITGVEDVPGTKGVIVHMRIL